MKYSTCRKVNAELTARIAQLHGKGYCQDFAIVDAKSLKCTQSNTLYPCCQLNVTLIDHVFDHILMKYNFVHAIETDCGQRGILLVPQIFFHKRESVVA